MTNRSSDLTILCGPDVIYSEPIAYSGAQEVDMQEDKKEIIIENLVKVIAHMVDLHDPTTAGHQCQVALLAKAIAQEICPEKEFVDCVFLAGQI